MSKVIPFSSPSSEPASRESLELKIRLLSRDSQNIFFDCPHVQLRMRERKVSIRQILDVLREGKICDGPNLDVYGDWRVKLKRFTAGRSVQVVVVMKENYLEVITVI